MSDQAPQFAKIDQGDDETFRTLRRELDARRAENPFREEVKSEPSRV